MSMMTYITPGLTKIDFEDNLFVTTELDYYANGTIKEYIESRGGVVKSSITKTTNYLIYEDEKEESSKYKKALDLVLNKGAEITILSRKSFEELVAMKYETPDVPKISFHDNTFVLAKSWYESNKLVKYIESRGGILKDAVTEETNYLIYPEGEKETENYLKAINLVRENNADIKILPRETFKRLITMTYETPGISECLIEGKRYVANGLFYWKDCWIYIGKHGGLISKSVTEDTDYLIYQDGYKDNWETEDYIKAVSLASKNNSHIIILPYSAFIKLNHRKWDIEFGSYPFDEDGGVKPIRWTILKRDGSKALLLSTYGLSAEPYNNKEYEDVTWETCSLRKWLNKSFYDNAFTDEEKRKILLTKIKTPDNLRNRTPGGNDTEDKVFLLSIDEAESYLTIPERITSATPYTAKHGVWGANGNCIWWLRSPGLRASYAAYVDSGGSLDSKGGYTHDDNYAVCPAMWVDLE